MSSLLLKDVNFKEIERIFFEIGCEVAQSLFKKYLEIIDKDLSENRNKKELRHKGKRENTIKTLMGEVCYKRVMYKRFNKDGSSEYIYLLDEELGMDNIGNISPNLVEKIAGHSCEMSYREVSSAISGLTNQSISHQGIWNIIQIIGGKQENKEKKMVSAYKQGKLNGEKEIPVLFEEADGLWLSMQGKDRKNSSKGRSEIKLGIAYEGCKKRYPGSKEYKTVEKIAVAGYAKASEFKDIRDAAIASKYNVDEINYRILNGDGAKWIRNGHEFENSIFQLDQYHLNKCITRNVYDKKGSKQISNWLKAGEFNKVFEKITELKYECGGLESEVKKLCILEEYIKNNIDGIVCYKDRNEINIPEPVGGIYYRNMGTMERNVNIFAKRMKGGKSWSKKGANNLAKIIALKIGKGFNDKIAALVSGKIPEKFVERFDEVLKSAKKARKKSVYPVHKGSIPFKNSKVIYGRKVIRSIFNLKPFTEITYR